MCLVRSTSARNDMRISPENRSQLLCQGWGWPCLHRMEQEEDLLLVVVQVAAVWSSEDNIQGKRDGSGRSRKSPGFPYFFFFFFPAVCCPYVQRKIRRVFCHHFTANSKGRLDPLSCQKKSGAALFSSIHFKEEKKAGFPRLAKETFVTPLGSVLGLQNPLPCSMVSCKGKPMETAVAAAAWNSVKDAPMPHQTRKLHAAQTELCSSESSKY